MLLLLSLTQMAQAQKFFNLTAQDVKIDSLLPAFTYSYPIGTDYADSVYTVSIAYPEFIDMTSADIARYRLITKQTGDTLPELPVITQRMAVSRKKGALEISFCPLVYRNHKYQILVSFMLDIQSKPLKRSMRRLVARTRSGAADRYAAHSVLASGNWAKIRVSESGIYQLTDALIRRAGFTDMSKVKIYGYGGALQNETLTADDLILYDDLKEVPTCTVGGKRLFLAQGPVSWKDSTGVERTRNPYSNYGYYFLTESDGEPLTVDSATLRNQWAKAADHYYTLFEEDNFSWYAGGRNLFMDDPITAGNSKSYKITTPGHTNAGRMTVAVTAGVNSSVSFSLNGTTLGTASITLGSYDKANRAQRTYTISNSQKIDTVTISVTSGGPVRLDYISFWWEGRPASVPALGDTEAAVPEYVYNITNQDHHADAAADMVIIIPTSQKLLTQAQRLKTFHEQHDSLRVNIVPADELYNEFSSGTPDANAYRRYLKMLYDRATTEDDMPRYLLLLGDCVWDNRMQTAACSSLDPDDYLLCYESENSFNEITCYVDDGFFCLLDDGEGANPQASDKLDVAVGRFPVTTEADAKIMVDKTINYAGNSNAGSWENTIMFMGDDGNENEHMKDADEVAEDVSALHPNYLIKKVMWDTYERETTTTGNTYPEVTSVIKQQQANGALIMNYFGHGNPYQISHESVLRINDFKSFTNKNLPLWITASCDIMPFDDVEENIGEACILNANGGAVAFFGTTRTVYANYNRVIDRAFMRYVLSFSNGKPVTLGEAQMLAKNYLISSGSDRTTNKLQYSLLGDPALALHLPQLTLTVDSVNGQSVETSSSDQILKAGTVARISGHVEGDNTFTGTLSAVVRDTRELITCRMNDTQETSTAFQYYDRTKTLFSGSDSIRNGRFSISFAVPKDINYAQGSGYITLFAASSDRTKLASGSFERFQLNGSALEGTDSIGPSIYCYLNSPSFVNGGDVNTTPYFVAQLTDEDGLNTTGSGIGHDLQLTIDGTYTYNLNDNFQYDFGSYTSGSTYYSIPELTPGKHKLLFTAWDVLNNSSTSELTFNVVEGLKPNILDADVSTNPATTTTTFIISHDRAGSPVDVTIEVFDMAGRCLWKHEEDNVTTDGAYTYTWDLSQSNGVRLQTGVYVFRALVSGSGSRKASKAKKLIVLSNN